MLAPICLFTYNRLWETQQTIGALKNNFLASESNLYIFSDGPKNDLVKQEINAVREYLDTVTGFKKVSVIKSNENKGLANSIISGVTNIIEKYGNVIVLEDDLITQPNFLDFMNEALEYYKLDLNLQTINGFSLLLKNNKPSSDIYFQKRPFPWGWATWSDRWNVTIFNKQQLRNEVNSNKSDLKSFKNECGNDIVKMFMDSIYDRNDSWYVRWTYSHFKQQRYSVFPKKSLVENIGFGELGTHCNGINSYQYEMDSENKSKFIFENFKKPSPKMTKKFLKYFSLWYKVLYRIGLLNSKIGREQLKSEIVMKLNKL